VAGRRRKKSLPESRRGKTRYSSIRKTVCLRGRTQRKQRGKREGPARREKAPGRRKKKDLNQHAFFQKRTSHRVSDPRGRAGAKARSEPVFLYGEDQFEQGGGAALRTRWDKEESSKRRRKRKKSGAVDRPPLLKKERTPRKRNTEINQKKKVDPTKKRRRERTRRTCLDNWRNHLITRGEDCLEGPTGKEEKRPLRLLSTKGLRREGKKRKRKLLHSFLLPRGRTSNERDASERGGGGKRPKADERKSTKARREEGEPPTWRRKNDASFCHRKKDEKRRRKGRAKENLPKKKRSGQKSSS